MNADIKNAKNDLLTLALLELKNARRSLEHWEDVGSNADVIVCRIRVNKARVLVNQIKKLNIA